MMFLLLLLLAHFLGDFVLQPNSWVKSKLEKGVLSTGFLKHILTHGILLFLVGLVLNSFWIPLLIVFISHIIIDALKILFLKKQDDDQFRLHAFIIDQILHLLIIFLVYFSTSSGQEWERFFQSDILLLILGYLFLTSPTSAIIRELLLPYTKEIEANQDQFLNFSEKEFCDEKQMNIHKSLKNGGHYIGILERILVFTFILIGQWAAVGFLITAKSVFRFGDLNQGKNRQFTEYVLIGTLLSFGFAIFTALIVAYLKGYLS